MPKVEFLTHDVEMPSIDASRITKWIGEVCRLHGRNAGRITYMFCSDDYILAENRHFLNHDTYTDIITFDYSVGDTASGDLLISLDTVRSNARLYAHEDFLRELHRVIIHGVLHLCGINDKGPGEREIMERHEDEALALLDTLAS